MITNRGGLSARDVTVRCWIRSEQYATWCDRDCTLTWMLSKHLAGTWISICDLNSEIYKIIQNLSKRDTEHLREKKERRRKVN